MPTKITNMNTTTNTNITKSQIITPQNSINRKLNNRNIKLNKLYFMVLITLSNHNLKSQIKITITKKYIFFPTLFFNHNDSGRRRRNSVGGGHRSAQAATSTRKTMPLKYKKKKLQFFQKIKTLHQLFIQT